MLFIEQFLLNRLVNLDTISEWLIPQFIEYISNVGFLQDLAPAHNKPGVNSMKMVFFCSGS